MSNSKMVYTICARGGSKGVAGKNLRLLGGEPLVVHAIRQARRCAAGGAGVYVSTDDPEIARVARDAGAEVPFIRPAELATDAAGKIPVIIHLRDYLRSESVEFDTIVDLDPTCPLRIDSDVLGAIKLLSADVDVVIGCTESRKNPYFNMVENDENGYARLVKALKLGPVSRQQAPKVFEISGAVYVWHDDTLDNGLWGGNAVVFELPPERSIDIDSELDFLMVEQLFAQSNG